MIFSNKLKIGVSTVLRVSTVIAFCLFMFIPIARAETPYDITSCHSGTIKLLFADKEMRIWSGEGWGIMISNHENKAFDNCTFHVMSVIQVMGERTAETSFLKVMDPDGDIVVAQTSRVGTESITKFIYGTGKYKGITGGGKSHRIVFGRIPPDSAAACSRGIGTFELPKK